MRVRYQTKNSLTNVAHTFITTEKENRIWITHQFISTPQTNTFRIQIQASNPLTTIWNIVDYLCVSTKIDNSISADSQNLLLFP